MNMNTMKKYAILILTAFCCGLCSCTAPEGPQTTGEPDGLDPVDPDADVHAWLTTADRSSLFEEQSFDFGAANSMSPYVVYFDRQERYQEMTGFGAALTGAACFNLMQMAQEDRTAFLEHVFGKSGLGSSLARVSIGASDFPASGQPFTWCDQEGSAENPLEHFGINQDDLAYLIPVLKEIYAINPDLKIIGSPWSAPRWMKSGKPEAWTGSELSADYYQTYAQYLVKWVQYMDEQGFFVYAVTPQNEPLNRANSMSMYMGWQQQRDFVKNALGPAIEQAQFSKDKPKILIFDHNYNYDNINEQQDYPRLIYQDQDASKYIAGSAWHNYNGDVSELDEYVQQFPDKDIYFTEASIGEWGYDFGNNLVEEFSSIFIGTMSRMGKGITVWNWMLDDKHGPHGPAGSCTNCYGVVDISSADYKTLTYNSQYYQIAHASKVIKPGAVRIGTSSREERDYVEYLAFENPDGSIGIIMVNRSEEEQKFVFSPQDRTYTVRYAVPARSLVSLLWNTK